MSFEYQITPPDDGRMYVVLRIVVAGQTVCEYQLSFNYETQQDAGEWKELLDAANEGRATDFNFSDPTGVNVGVEADGSFYVGVLDTDEDSEYAPGARFTVSGGVPANRFRIREFLTQMHETVSLLAVPDE